MAYTTKVRVRFGDEDHAQIVYYPRFFNFFHVAFEDFFGDQGHPYQKVLDEDQVGFPTVHIEDFEADRGRRAGLVGAGSRGIA